MKQIPDSRRRVSACIRGFRPWCLTAIVGMLVMMGPSQARAQDVWTLLPMSGQGVNVSTTRTFRALLQSELAARTNAQFVDANAPCADAPCARDIARSVGAGVVLFGTLNMLGEKIIAMVTVIDVPSGTRIAQQRMTVDRVEDLEAVSVRMAKAIVEGKTIDETGELGNITHKESQRDTRREGASGLGIRFGGVSPLGHAFKAGFGVHMGLGYWYEARDFAIEPRVRYRTSTEAFDEGGWHALDMDLGAFYILSRSDFAPYVGGGAGLRLIEEQRGQSQSDFVGITQAASGETTDSTTAMGAFVRLGLMLFRTYTVRVSLDLDYDVTFSDLFRDGSAHTALFGMGALF